MAKEGLRYQIFSRRALLIGGVQLFGFSALAARLYYLSVVKGESYRLRADENRIAVKLLAPERGEILDRNGKKLAVNQQDFRIFLVPEEADNVASTLDKIGELVPISERRRAKIERQISRQPKFWSVAVANNLSWEEFARLNVAIPDLPGVTPDAGQSRFYPESVHSAHIIGYLGDPPREQVDRTPLFRVPGFKIGRDGLENKYDDRLRGVEGSRRVEVNAYGREIRELPPRKDAQRGADMTLTIDAELQRYCAEQLGEEAAGAVAIDLKTGELLSFVSTPSFDPNEFTFGLSSENWNALLSDPRKPLLNKCISGQFPPGSTFKMVVALTALEKGIIGPETSFFCNGRHKLGNHTFNCWKRDGHGHVNLSESIAQSCDVYYYKIAEKLDIDDIAATARKFGLGDIHDISLDGQKAGLIPTKEWKLRTQRVRWQKGDTVNAAIGQGFVLATPLQLAVMTARLATGRNIRPRLVREQTYAGDERFEALDVNPFHLSLIRQAMEKVTSRGGTAYDPRRPKSAPEFAGKTGTAQVRRITVEERRTQVLKNNELPWQYRDHAIFVGYGPAPEPRVAVSLIIQHGGSGSGAAAPVARKIFDKAMQLIEQQEQKPEA